MYKNIILIIVSCILLQGCIDIPLPQSQANQYKRVAVISDISDEFPANRSGFHPEYRRYNIDLGINHTFVAAAVSALSAKYEVTDLSQYGKQFADQPKYWPETQTVIGTETRLSAGEVIRRLVSPATYDAYIVISPGPAIDANGAKIYGVGIHKIPGLFTDGGCLIYAGAIVSVIDGKNYDAIARVYSPSDARAVGIDCRAWAAPDQSISTIKPMLDALITRSVPQILKNAQLIQ